jgi:thiamine biosynthesis lipoprotein
MGMPVSLALRGRHTRDARARRAWADVLRWLAHVDATFSTYRADSVVSRIDRGELGVSEAPAEVRRLLDLAERAHRVTEGWFSVSLPRDGDRHRLDPSGLVKGWAVDRGSVLLAGLDGTDHCLSAGGDLACTTGAHDESPWRVGVEDPADPTRTVAVVPMLGGGCATSGDRHRGAHVVDPRTGLPPRPGGSVTVVGPSLTWADVWATAGYARGADAAGWLAQVCPLTTLVVDPAGGLTTTAPVSRRTPA